MKVCRKVKDSLQLGLQTIKISDKYSDKHLSVVVGEGGGFPYTFDFIFATERTNVNYNFFYHNVFLIDSTVLFQGNHMKLLWRSLPLKPGQLGEVGSMTGRASSLMQSYAKA